MAATLLELAPLARLLDLDPEVLRERLSPTLLAEAATDLRAGRYHGQSRPWPLAFSFRWRRPPTGAASGAGGSGEAGERDLNVTLVVSGLGKANAAAALAATAARLPAQPTVVHLGIGGVYPGSELPLGSAAVAASERDLDLGVGEDRSRAGLEAIGLELVAGLVASNRIELLTPLARAVATAAEAPLVDFATSDGVTASPAAARDTAERYSVAIESMEGFAAAQVALAFGLEYVEVRGVSNRVGERDRAAWHIGGAAAAAAAAAHAALALL